MFRHALAAAAAVSLSAGAASAATFVLDFEGLQDLEPINDFYNGGTGGFGSSGPDYGVQFSSVSLALIDSDAGGSGNTANEPSPETTLVFLDDNAATMNVLGGFDTGFSFFYSSVSFDGQVTVYDGLNGTGNVLASLVLPALGSGNPGDPNGAYNTWAPVGVTFAGTALSVDFGGTANFIVYDDVTLGSDTPGRVPVPAALPLLAGGLGLLGLIRRRA